MPQWRCRLLETTKQRTRYGIALPEEAMAVLRWHVETQLETDEQRASDLLFPAINGAFRSPSVLNKPFEDVSSRMGLGYTFTQRGMRRTFNDLARAAHVGDLVTRSISRHATPRMQARSGPIPPQVVRQVVRRPRRWCALLARNEENRL